MYRVKRIRSSKLEEEKNLKLKERKTSGLILDKKLETFFGSSPYAKDNYDELFLFQEKHRVDSNYLRLHTDFDAGMREVLVNWLYDIGVEQRLMNITVALAVSITDQYFSKTIVTLREIQLVGITALFMATKYCEKLHITLKYCVGVSVRLYTCEEIVSMEFKIFKFLDFNLKLMTSIDFFQHFVHIANWRTFPHQSARFFLELFATKYSMLKYLPSTIAATSIYLAWQLENKQLEWDDSMVQITKTSLSSINECINDFVANDLTLETAGVSVLQRHRLPKTPIDSYFSSCAINVES